MLRLKNYLPSVAYGAKVVTGDLALEVATVTVTAGGPTGTATVTAGNTVIGIYPAGNQDQYVDNVAISGATLTVTLAANATADNVFKVTMVKA